jgi:hypothetical protein
VHLAAVGPITGVAAAAASERAAATATAFGVGWRSYRYREAHQGRGSKRRSNSCLHLGKSPSFLLGGGFGLIG